MRNYYYSYKFDCPQVSTYYQTNGYYSSKTYLEYISRQPPAGASPTSNLTSRVKAYCSYYETYYGNFCPPDTRKREFVITILAPLIALSFVAIVGVMIYRRRVALRAKLAKLFSGDPAPIMNRQLPMVKTQPTSETVQNIIILETEGNLEKA